MKLRIGDPWMTARDYGHSLTGLTLNLLVRDTEKALLFHREVLGGSVVYSDPDFAVVRACGSEWMLHTDHTYQGHPMSGALTGDIPRGVGVELRLHGCDPDKAAAQAQRLGFTVLAPPADKPHGLREAFIVDADGYVWVPDVHSA